MPKKDAKSGMEYEEGKTSVIHVTASAVNRLNNDITKMRTREILKRVYRRHQLGLWQFASFVLVTTLAATNIM